MKIAIGCDHAGFLLKPIIAEIAKEAAYEVIDFGTYSLDSVDYPDFVHPVCKALINSECKFGILICGSGNGVAITANKYKEIRAALCWNEEIASLARKHNNANVLCIPARFVSNETAKQMFLEFINTAFEGGRHQKRVQKITSGLL